MSAHAYVLSSFPQDYDSRRDATAEDYCASAVAISLDLERLKTRAVEMANEERADEGCIHGDGDAELEAMGRNPALDVDRLLDDDLGEIDALEWEHDEEGGTWSAHDEPLDLIFVITQRPLL